MTSWRRMTSRYRHGLGTAGPPRPLQADTPVTWVTKVNNEVVYRTSNGRFPKRENRSLVLHSTAEQNGVSMLREGGHRPRDVRAFLSVCGLHSDITKTTKRTHHTHKRKNARRSLTQAYLTHSERVPKVARGANARPGRPPKTNEATDASYASGAGPERQKRGGETTSGRERTAKRSEAERSRAKQSEQSSGKITANRLRPIGFCVGRQHRIWCAGVPSHPIALQLRRGKWFVK